MESVGISLSSLQENFEEYVEENRSYEQKLLDDRECYKIELDEFKKEYQQLFLAYQYLHKSSQDPQMLGSLVQDLNKLKEKYDHKLSKLEKKIVKTESYIDVIKRRLADFDYCRTQIELIKENIKNYISFDAEPMITEANTTETMAVDHEVIAHNLLSNILNPKHTIDTLIGMKNSNATYQMSYEVIGSLLVIYFDDHEYSRVIYHKFNGSVISEQIENYGIHSYDNMDNRVKITYATLHRETYEYFNACMETLGSIKKFFNVDPNIKSLELRFFKQSYYTKNYLRRYWVDRNNIVPFNISRVVTNNKNIGNIMQNIYDQNCDVEFDSTRITYIIKPH
jgi:hypothetical protein